MGSIHFLFSGTEASIAAVSKLESGEETKLPMYYIWVFVFFLLDQLTGCTYMPVYQFLFLFVGPVFLSLQSTGRTCDLATMLLEMGLTNSLKEDMSM
jgi:hypothetical protein